MGMFWASCQNHKSGGGGGGIPLDYISYWPLEGDAGGGTVLDSGPENTTLNMISGGSFSQGISAGTNSWQGNASAYLSSESTSKALDYLTPKHTVSLWIYMPNDSGYYYIYDNHAAGYSSGSSSNNGSYIDILGGFARCGFFVRNSESFTDTNGNSNTSYIITAKSNIKVTANQWQSVIAYYDQASKTARLYINGVLNCSVTSSQTPNFNATSRGGNVIGALKYLDISAVFYQIDGRVDEVRHYSRELTQQEITDLATIPTP